MSYVLFNITYLLYEVCIVFCSYAFLIQVEIWLSFFYFQVNFDSWLIVHMYLLLEGRDKHIIIILGQDGSLDDQFSSYVLSHLQLIIEGIIFTSR